VLSQENGVVWVVQVEQTTMQLNAKTPPSIPPTVILFRIVDVLGAQCVLPLQAALLFGLHC